MKKTQSIILVLCLLLVSGLFAVPAVAKKATSPDLAFSFHNFWNGGVNGRAYSVVEDKGVNGSKALEIKALNGADGGDMDVWNLKDKTAVSDWTGVEQIWFWLDASDYGTEELRVSLAFQEGEANGIQAWGVKEGAKAYLYSTVSNNGWSEVTCVKSTLTTWNPGRIPVPAGFVGWIAYNASDLTCYVSTTTDLPIEFDAKNINQFNSGVIETNDSAVGKSAYADCYGIVGTAVKGTACPVTPANSGYKFIEVWGFEGVGTSPESDKLSLDSIWSGERKDKSFGIAAGKGLNGTNAMAIRADIATRDYDIDLFADRDSSYITDWSGAEQIWFWIDGSSYGTTDFEVSVSFAELDKGAGDAYDGAFQAFGIKAGAKAMIYDTKANNGWTEVVCTNTTLTGWNPGRITLPAGFVGWVAYNISDFNCYVDSGAPKVFDLKNVNRCTTSVAVPNASAVGDTLYIDSYAIVGTNVNGGACPVAANNANYKFLEVWGFDSLAACPDSVTSSPNTGDGLVSVSLMLIASGIAVAYAVSRRSGAKH